MFNFLTRSSNNSKINAEHIELVSLHIPKSAGTSFRNTLKKVYGQTAVLRVDVTLEKGEGEKKALPFVKVNEKHYQKKALPKSAKVIHGHFSPASLNKGLSLPPDVPYITWFRHPVERVISNYYYLVERLEAIVKEEQRGVDILQKLVCDLEQYAQRPLNRNRIKKFMRGKPLKEFTFVGIQEHYEEDLAAMSQHFGWPKPPVLHHNRTGKKREIDDTLRQKIAEWNEQDMRLYEKALALRTARLEK